MLRLYDRILASPPRQLPHPSTSEASTVEPLIRRLLPSCPVYRCNRVAYEFFTSAPQEALREPVLKDLRLRTPTLFLEAELPPLVSREGGRQCPTWFSLPDPSAPRSWGAFVFSTPMGGNGERFLGIPVHEALDFFLYLEWNRGHPLGPCFALALGLDEGGQIARDQGRYAVRPRLLCEVSEETQSEFLASGISLTYPLLRSLSEANASLSPELAFPGGSVDV